MRLLNIAVSVSYMNNDEERTAVLVKSRELADSLGMVRDNKDAMPGPWVTDHYSYVKPDEAVQLMPMENLEVKILSSREIDTGPDLMQVASELMGLQKLPQVGGGQEFNQRIEVHTPGNAMLAFNELRLAEDMCTDALQNILDEGWRVMAVCPQPDQRRPDYVLGRWNPNREAGQMGQGAKR